MIEAELNNFIDFLSISADARGMSITEYITLLTKEMEMSNLNRDELLSSFIEVKMKDDESFLKIKESLTRIGIANMKRDKLTQTAHIFQKRGQYYIVHFLEMFALDGKDTNFNEDDKKRTWVIAQLLESWGLLDIVTEVPADYKELKPYMFGLTILDYKSKSEWELSAKYTIGGKK